MKVSICRGIFYGVSRGRGGGEEEWSAGKERGRTESLTLKLSCKNKNPHIIYLVRNTGTYEQ